MAATNTFPKIFCVMRQRAGCCGSTGRRLGAHEPRKRSQFACAAGEVAAFRPPVGAFASRGPGSGRWARLRTAGPAARGRRETGCLAASLRDTPADAGGGGGGGAPGGGQVRADAGGAPGQGGELPGGGRRTRGTAHTHTHKTRARAHTHTHTTHRASCVEEARASARRRLPRASLRPLGCPWRGRRLQFDQPDPGPRRPQVRCACSRHRGSFDLALCACVLACVRACVRARARACVYVCVCVRFCVLVCLCMGACVCLCVLVCVRACVRARVCVIRR